MFLVRSLLTTVLMFSGFVVSVANADPITPGEIVEWTSRVARNHRLSSVTEVPDYIHRLLADAESAISRDEYSEENLRNLGEALHLMGHLAEHAHDFSKARKLHQSSIRAFKRTSLKARGSGLPGDRHAVEHIFMNYYDEAIQQQRRGNLSEAQSLFDQAWEFSTDNHIPQSLNSAGVMERFTALEGLKTDSKPTFDLQDYKLERIKFVTPRVIKVVVICDEMLTRPK